MLLQARNWCLFLYSQHLAQCQAQSGYAIHVAGTKFANSKALPRC